MSLDVNDIRRQFPILHQQIDGNPLIYLDTAATAQVPQAVLDAMHTYETQARSNVHRGMHVLAERSTIAYEEARLTVQKFLNADRKEEIIFTKNCTEAINLVAQSWGRQNLSEGDGVALSILEHHSNIVPWQQLDASILWIEAAIGNWQLAISQLGENLKSKNVKLVAITGQSNVLGVQPPLKEIIDIAHDAGALVLVDAAQLVTHHPVDVQGLDCDFLVFSGHKLYGPTGVGVLYAKREHLENMPPFLGGGSMIHEVTQDGFTSADIPQKFEAGTPPISAAVGLAAAIEWLNQFDWKAVKQHEQEILNTATKRLESISDLKIFNFQFSIFNSDFSGCISFTIDGVHPHDLTEILGRQGICLRAGHHCCQPLHDALGITASTRLSVGLYNSVEEVDRVGEAIEKAIKRIKY